MINNCASARLRFLLAAMIIVSVRLLAQDTSGAEEDGNETESIFPHPASRFWLSGQTNFIFQTHPSFPAKYSGPNSLRADYEKATSRVLTLYTGVQLGSTTDVIFDLESAGGRGISDALGVAGFTNLDVVRNPTLGSKPYLARLMVHHVFRLSKEDVAGDRGSLSLESKLPARRIEVWGGKLSTADFFDTNSIASDSHLQFMNWSIDNTGAYDYAADTRGYTYGAIVAYRTKTFGVQFGEMLMPQIANGIDMEFNLRRAHSENIELQFHRNFLANRPGTLRFLTFVNHANMGVYSDAIAQFRAGITTMPDITAHPRLTRIKYGFVVNGEQELARGVGAFVRLGWNDGKTESFAYTEVDNTVAVGATVRGTLWRRSHDRAALAFVSNGISSSHSQYLALGGIGFLLGDGALTYDREQIIEAYYRLHIWRGITVGPDIQHITNPGYNRDRGPVLVPGFRLHLEL